MNGVRLSPIDRIPAIVSLAATNPDGSAATITNIALAALPRGYLPAADTAWVTATYANGQAPITLAGPSATAQPGDIAITDSSYVWAKDTGADHTQAVIVGFAYID